MKRNLTLIILLTLSLHGFSVGDKLRIGIMTSPGISWANPTGNDLKAGKARFGIDYGVVVEYWFADNYGFSTGLSGAYDGANISGRRAFEDSANVKIRSVNEKYNFNYLEIPLYLKLKTNDIKGGNFNVWGQIGVTINFTVSARATFDNNIGPDSLPIIIEKENVLRHDNAVTAVIPGFHANFIDVRLGAGAGFEYKLDDKTSVLVGLFYHNGFINNIIDNNSKGNPILMRSLSLRVGILF